MGVRPRLSFVVTTRNDNHGGDLNKRTQIFIDTLAEQLNRFKIPSELIFVEWNPPKNRPPLVQAFQWPKEGYCQVRVITVPEHIHKRFRYSDKLPLFQMIAKNVGVRRAHGEFVIQTNVDIVFEDDLIRFMGSKDLKGKTLYRSSRVDVDAAIDSNWSTSEKLTFCRNHVLRVARQDGIYLVHPKSPNRDIRYGMRYSRTAVESVFPELFYLRNVKGAPRYFEAYDRVSGTVAEGYKKFKKLVKERIDARIYPLGMVALATPRAFHHYMRTILRLHRYGFRPESKRIDNELWATDWQTLPELHTNACGDFMLMDRESWWAMRSSPEIEAYSFHIDSLTMINAYRMGFEVVNLPEDKVHYHIEHGGGWTPESEARLYQNMNRSGVAILTYSDYARYAAEMMQDKLKFFAGPDWGLASEVLSDVKVTSGFTETETSPKRRPRAPGVELRT